MGPDSVLVQFRLAPGKVSLAVTKFHINNLVCLYFTSSCGGTKHENDCLLLIKMHRKYTCFWRIHCFHH